MRKKCRPFISGNDFVYPRPIFTLRLERTKVAFHFRCVSVCRSFLLFPCLILGSAGASFLSLLLSRSSRRTDERESSERANAERVSEERVPNGALTGRSPVSAHRICHLLEWPRNTLCLVKEVFLLGAAARSLLERPSLASQATS